MSLRQGYEDTLGSRKYLLREADDHYTHDSGYVDPERRRDELANGSQKHLSWEHDQAVRQLPNVLGWVPR